MVAGGMDVLAEGLVGRPDVTTVFLPRRDDGSLGVARREGGHLEPLSSDLLQMMLTAAGWRGGPVQVWAPGTPAARRAAVEGDGSADGAAEVSSEDGSVVDASADDAPEPGRRQLQLQLELFARDLMTEFWVPEESASQHVVDGRLTAQGDGPGSPWHLVGPDESRRGERGVITPPVWLTVASDGSLIPRRRRRTVVFHHGAASLTLPDYLQQLPFLRALGEANSGIFELVYPEEGFGLELDEQFFRRDVDEYEEPQHVPSFTNFLQQAGWREHRGDIRLWTAGGPRESAETLHRFSELARAEVLVLDGDSHGVFRDGELRAVDRNGRPSEWRMLGPFADTVSSRWESIDGVARLRPADAVVRTNTGLINTSSAEYWSAVNRANGNAGRDDVFEVRGFEVRRNDSGNAEF
ncbi:hypothetical protein, partial [Frankia sp. AvcI1]|uniref:hypothetical protein n=1 Tax=Frankia sp. AvcI1 TaxID=573496 RepID=UPI001F3997AF